MPGILLTSDLLSQVPRFGSVLSPPWPCHLFPPSSIFVANFFLNHPHDHSKSASSPWSVSEHTRDALPCLNTRPFNCSRHLCFSIKGFFPCSRTSTFTGFPYLLSSPISVLSFLHHSTCMSLVVLACMHARLMWLNTIALGLLPVTVAESSTAPQLALPPEISAIVLEDAFLSISTE